jgi:hypothetical protein
MRDVPLQQTTLLEELSAAARGCLALLMGDRRAPGYFDFSQRGLAGSFVAFLTATLINAVIPIAMGIETPPGSITRGLILVAILFAVQIGFSALVLRQIGRLDGLVPYLVADNWATFFITIFSTLMMVAGVGDEVAIIALGILVIIIEINIARLIVTLPGLQIAMFLIAQLVGVTIVLLVIGLVWPPAAELVNAASSAGSTTQ